MKAKKMPKKEMSPKEMMMDKKEVKAGKVYVGVKKTFNFTKGRKVKK